MPRVHSPEQFLHVLRQHVLKHKDDRKPPKFKRVNTGAPEGQPSVGFRCSTCEDPFQIEPTYDVSLTEAVGPEQHILAVCLEVRAGHFIKITPLTRLRVVYEGTSVVWSHWLNVSTYVGDTRYTLRAINLVPGAHVLRHRGPPITRVSWDLGDKLLRGTPKAQDPKPPAPPPTAYEMLDD